MTETVAGPARSTNSRWRLLRILWPLLLAAGITAGALGSLETILRLPVESLALCVVSAAFVAIPLSSLDRMFAYTTAATVLGIALPSADPWHFLTMWAIGYLLNMVFYARDIVTAAEVTLYSALAGTTAVFAYRWVDETVTAQGLAVSLEPLFGPAKIGQVLVALLAFHIVRLVIWLLRTRLLTGLPAARILGSITWRRIFIVVAVSTSVIVIGRLLSVQLDAVIGLQGGLLGTLVLISLVSGALFALWYLLDSTRQRARFRGIVEAVVQLPWPEHEAALTTAQSIVRRTLRRSRVSAHRTVDTRRDHLVSAPIIVDGQEFRLLVERAGVEPPFDDHDRVAVDAVARLANESLRIGNEIGRLQEEARTDSLTGLLNYRSFQTALASLGRRGVGAEQAAIIYIDLDNFKSINDRFGHEVGNIVLRTIAARLQSTVRPGDLVARVGGDEFVVLLQGEQVRKTAEEIVQRLSTILGDPLRVGGTTVVIGATLGVSVSRDGERDFTGLVERADLRMYAARGRALAAPGAWAVTGQGTPLAGEFAELAPPSEPVPPAKGGSAPPPPASVPVVGGVVQAVRDAILRDRLELVYQPVVDMVAGRIVAVEALVRLTDPRHGAVPVALVVHEAARFGLLQRLTVQVLTKASKDLLRLREQEPQLRQLQVNISLEHIGDVEVHSQLRRIHEQSPDVEIVLEINEDSLGGLSEEQVDQIQQLSASGLAKVGLDDYGRAYSNLVAVLRSPFDVLKIDKQVADACERPAAGPIVSALVQATAELGAMIIFEGVERPSQAASLQRFGARYAQGFLYGRALSVDELLLRFEGHGLRAELTPATGD